MLAFAAVGCGAASADDEGFAPVSLPVTATGTFTGFGTSKAYCFALNPGESVAATVVAGARDSLFGLSGFPIWTRGPVWSSASTQVSPWALRAHFVASCDTTSYGFSASGSIGTTYTIEIGLPTRTATRFSVAGVGLHGGVASRAPFRVTTRVWPGYDGFHGLGGPVRFVIERRRHGVWRPFSSADGNMLARWNSASTPVVGHLKLPAGTYRIRARLIDATHRRGIYGPPRVVVVR
jgi:hypothetical protein